MLRHGLAGALTSDALHGILLLLDVLQIHSGDHGDAVIQDVIHVLPALGIAAARGIIVRQFIHQAHARMTAEDGRHIQNLVILSGVGLPQRGDALDFGHEGVQVGCERTLDGAHHHVLAALLAAAPLVQHAE